MALLLADLDTPTSHAANTWGWVTRLLAAVVSVVARGHRYGTHDVVLAPAVIGVLAWLCQQHQALRIIMLALGIGLTLQALVAVDVIRRSAGFTALNFAASVAVAWALASSDSLIVERWWVVAAGGVVIHALGDVVMDSGIPVPVVWLWRRDARLRIPLVSTGSVVERSVVSAALVVLLGWLVKTRLGVTSVGEVVVLVGGGLDRAASEFFSWASDFARRGV